MRLITRSGTAFTWDPATRTAWPAQHRRNTLTSAEKVHAEDEMPREEGPRLDAWLSVSTGSAYRVVLWNDEGTDKPVMSSVFWKQGRWKDGNWQPIPQPDCLYTHASGVTQEVADDQVARE